VTDLTLIGAAAALGGLLLGGLFGAWLMDRRIKRRLEEVGSEVARLHQIAEAKLGGDDPDLPSLLRDLNKAVEQTYRAADALENQSAVTRRKSEGGKEITASSKHIIRMMEDMGADMPAVKNTRRQPKLSAKSDGKRKSPPLE